MDKKLSILVPQYKEDFEIIRPLLDSIQIQQDVNFDEIEVIILNDGSNVLLSEDKLKNYSFDIIYKVRKKNKGVSATRNELFEYANGEYIMYCDADDMFFNVMGLFLIIREIKRGFDIFASSFIEENRINNEPAFVIKQDNRTFVHGKVLRKQYLIDKDIKWKNELKIHEDYYYFAQAFCLTSNIRYCPEYFYLWKWRDDSVCRKDKEFLYKTYKDCIYSQKCLMKELLRKNAVEQAEYYCVKFVYEVYSMINNEQWLKSKYRQQTLKAFADFYNEFKYLFKSSTDKDMFIQQQRIDTKKFAKFIRELKKYEN